jgi:SPP1 gp7 family putative phage head morphogenesis protein
MAKIDAVLSDFRKRVSDREQTAVRALVERWMGVESRLDSQVTALTLEIDNLRLTDQPVSRAQILRLQRYLDLLSQTRYELDTYNQWAAGAIGTEQGFYADLGAQHFNAMMSKTVPVSVQWNRMNLGMVNAMIGYAGDGAPLADLLRKDYPKTFLELTQALIDGAAQGWNPRKTAQMMKAAMGYNLDRALVIARTETLRVARASVQMGMEENGDIIDGWVWHSALSPTTCPVCWSLHGSIHPLSEKFQDHVCGRCTSVPHFRDGVTASVPKIPTGDSVLSRKGEEFQRSILGPERYRLWKQGIPLDQMVTWKEDVTWGRSPGLKPLKEMQNAE